MDRKSAVQMKRMGLVAFFVGVLILTGWGSHTAYAGGNCARTSVGLTPLNDLGLGTYKGLKGGLYLNGSNVMPSRHLMDGITLAANVVPRDTSGRPASTGKIVLLSIGMSNTSGEFGAFKSLVRQDSTVNPTLVLVNGAQGGATAALISNPTNPGYTRFWGAIDLFLQQAGLSRAQVQAVWLKEADAGPSGDDIVYAQTLGSELEKILRELRSRFVNLKLVHMSSRIYAGYATGGLNPEPYAYASGFAVKGVIEKQINGNPTLNYNPALGPVRAPWTAWAAYLWADGLRSRRDGLTWRCEDFASDGTHPSSIGAQKVAGQLLNFYKQDPTTRSWFLRN
jgi:hypothetical protein